MIGAAGLTLAARFERLQLNRIGLSACAVLAAVIGRAEGRPLAVLAIVYALVTTGLEILRRDRRWRSVLWVQALLFLDVVLIRLVIVSGQDPLGPFAFMSFVHVVGVMILLPHRIGLRVAFAHGITAFVFTTLRVAGIFGAPINSDDLRELSVSILGLLLVALATAVFGRAVDQEREARRQEAEGLAALAQALQDETEAEGVAALLCDSVTQTLGYRSAAVVLSATAAPAGDRTVLVRDPSTLDPDLAEAIGPATNLVVVPLGRAGACQGVAAFEWGGTSSDGIPADLVSLTERFCLTAISALRRVALQQEIERLATEDALTGLPNRRVFDEALDRQVSRSARYNAPFSLLVIDIDMFKTINDTHGHAAGDAVLRHVGSVLRLAVRDSDLAARFGGEEFVVLLPEGPVESARTTAEKVRQRLGDGSGPLPFTVSIGVASCPTHGSAAGALFEAADRALYVAKNAGRNRVVVAATPRTDQDMSGLAAATA